MGKIEMRVDIDGDLAEQARAADERAQHWARENAEAIRIHNTRVAERGLFGEDMRRW